VIEIAELFVPYPSTLWTLAQQIGVNHAVTVLPYEPPAPGAAAPTAPRSWEKIHGLVPLAAIPRDADGAYPWDFAPLQAMQARYAAAGLKLGVIESSPPMERVRLGLPGRDEEIGQINVMLRAMGRLGIGVWCYNFMAAASWGRTNLAAPARGGALVTAFDQAQVPPLALPAGQTLTHAQLWDNYRYFLERVVPVAEAAGVRLALHHDDPPVPWMGPVPRLFSSVQAFQQALDLAPSPANALTLCQGNFALITDDLPGVIEHFGAQRKIAFVHLRDVRGTATRFEETFHDLGQTDLIACLRAYQAVDYHGLLRPDHVPTLAGEDNASPGYATLGRLYAVGYIRGLCEAVYGRTAA
jgi:mannonate dehydratase